MVNQRTSVQAQFYRGNYDALVHRWSAQPSSLERSDFVYILGSLVFSGRSDEASAFYGKIQSDLSTADLWIALFFRMIQAVRTGRVDAAENLLREIQGERISSKSTHTRFFQFQARAFYHYYLGQLQVAEVHLTKSLAAAVRADFTWGRLLALDMMAHALVQRGEFAKALLHFKTCRELATDLANENLIDALEISIVLAEARLQIPSDKTISELGKLLHRTRVHDTYSYANVRLELARQATLLGRWEQAELELGHALKLIYQYQNAKQELVLNFRWAYLLFCQGEIEKALNFISVAKAKVERAREESLQLAVLGLEEKMIRSLDFPTDFKETLRTKAETVRVVSRSYIDDRIRARQSERPLFASPGDPLGHCLDQMARSKNPAADLIASGLLGLLKTEGHLPARGVGVMIDLSSRQVICSDLKSIQVFSFGAKQKLFDLLCIFLGGQKSRPEIFLAIWKMKYVSRLHDSVLNASIANLRKHFGRFGYLIETVEHGYRLQPAFAVYYLGRAEFALGREEPALIINRKIGLNDRQARLLQSMKPNELMDTRTYARLFQISTATANRDLRQLAQTKRLVRRGQSRDIAYEIVSP